MIYKYDWPTHTWLEQFVELPTENYRNDRQRQPTNKPANSLHVGLVALKKP